MGTAQIIDGRYEILQPLGEGGFGTVFLAVQRGFERRVAIKILRNELTDEEAGKRFHREAKLLSVMNHPNIALFIGSGMWEQRQYTALEFIPGITLQQRLRAGRLDGAEIKSLAMGILSGLAHAHNAGVIHRDLKPANIIIQDGTQIPKLIDFGLASSNVDQQKLTQEGCAIGTTLYMAPEQCMGFALTPAADLYALGCILYHCTAGRAPFEAPDAVAVMHMQLNEAPRTILTKTAAEERFVDWLERLLEKEPSKRFASAQDAARALGAIDLNKTHFSTVALGTPTPKSQRDIVKPAVMLAVAVACGATLAFSVYNKPSTVAEPADFGIPIARIASTVPSKKLQTIIDERLANINELVASLNGKTLSDDFHDKVEKELMSLAECAYSQNFRARELRALTALARLPWHARQVRLNAVRQLRLTPVTNVDDALPVAESAEKGIAAMTPAVSPADVECVPQLYVIAMDSYRLAKRPDDGLRMTNDLIRFATEHHGAHGWTLHGLVHKAILLNESNKSTPAERIATATAAYDLAVKSPMEPTQKAMAIQHMGRIVMDAGDYARARKFFEEAISTLPEAPELSVVINKQYLLDNIRLCESRLQH